MKNRESGFTLVEVLVSFVIIGMATITIFMFLGSMSRQTVNVKDQTFATQKAIQMMEELRSLIGRTDRIGVLDEYDDGSDYNAFLTTENTAALGNDPLNPVSGNIRMGTGYRYLRQVIVQKISSDPYMRKVKIEVWLADENNPSSVKKLLAQAISVVKTSTAGYIPTQVLDLYLIAITNVPGRFAAVPDMKSMAHEMITDLQTRNPGLEIRQHWITMLGYGRDPDYAPYTNEETSSENLTDIPHVYYYPGVIPRYVGADYLGDVYYFIPGDFPSRINVDNVMRNTTSYSVVDRYNHCKRYPEEKVMYDAYCAEAYAGGEDAPEMTLRMLFEKMNSSPSEFKNALIVNLHGQVLPCPPMRNYSDAAKNPGSAPYVRVVTHPESLSYSSGPGSVNLRVYPYVMNPDSWAHDSVLESATICFPGKDFTGSGVIVVNKCVGNTITAYSWVVATSGVDYTLALTGDGTTVLTLNNSPLRHAQNVSQGLPSAKRLYGLEYIPCPMHPVASSTTFDSTLATIGNYPKNTARWAIRIGGSVLTDTMYTVDTRIGNTISTGYPNFSRTYFWVGTTPPVTEQYQFVGDPRHCPYADVKRNHGYNWYFRSVTSDSSPGYDRTYGQTGQPGWQGFDATEKHNIDISRYSQVVRNGIMSITGLYNAVSGYISLWHGIGGDISDGAGYLLYSLRAPERPWDPSGTSTALTWVNEAYNITANYRMGRIIARTTGSWYSRYWIGELYPDDQYSYWQTWGNLPTGPGNFYRALGTSLGVLPFDFSIRSYQKASVAFVHSGTSASHYSHTWNTVQGAITADGTTMAGIFNFPPVTPVDVEAPFRLDSNLYEPPNWATPEYAAITRPTSTIVKEYYNNSTDTNWKIVAGVKLETGTLVGYFVPQGLEKMAGFGAAQICRLGLQAMIHTFMTTGEPAVATGRIVQVPLLSVSNPQSGEEYDVGESPTIPVQWSISWTRWDGEKYTSAYSDAYAGDGEPVVYNLKYSSDNGRTWYFVQDDSQAIAGERDVSRYLSPPYTWDINAVKAMWGSGTYLLRVEGYRQNLPLHYTYHLIRIYIQK